MPTRCDRGFLEGILTQKSICVLRIHPAFLSNRKIWETFLDFNVFSVFKNLSFPFWSVRSPTKKTWTVLKWRITGYYKFQRVWVLLHWVIIKSQQKLRYWMDPGQLDRIIKFKKVFNIISSYSLAYLQCWKVMKSHEWIIFHFSKVSTFTLPKTNSSPLKMMVSKFGISWLPGERTVSFRESKCKHSILQAIHQNSSPAAVRPWRCISCFTAGPAIFHRKPWPISGVMTRAPSGNLAQGAGSRKWRWNVWESGFQNYLVLVLFVGALKHLRA